MQHNRNKQHTAVAIDLRSPKTIPMNVNSHTLVPDRSGNGTLTNASQTTAETKPNSVKGDALNGVPNQVRTTIISVLLVDDHALMREGLRQLLELEQDMRVIGEAVDGFEALYKIRRLQPEVVLMDIRMPMVDGIALTRQITHEFPEIAVIMLTMSSDHQQMLQAMKNGAKGYLLKSASSQDVTQAIRTVYEGGMLIEPGLTGAMVREFRRLSTSSSPGRNINALSEKEIEILRYVAAGMSNKEIAEKLAYSEKTVKNYLSLIFQKLGIRDRTQAAIFALRQGFLPDEDMSS